MDKKEVMKFGLAALAVVVGVFAADAIKNQMAKAKTSTPAAVKTV